MNKEELLNELYKLNRFEVSIGVLDFMSKTAVKFDHVLALVEQLDEPEKVVVPQFVADWIEIHRERESNAWHLMNNVDIKADRNVELWTWLWGDNNADLIARAWLDGYEIEKEPLYYVRFAPDTYLNLVKSDGVLFFSDMGQFDDIQTQFTELEIKAIDERYWQFSEPVEEEEE